MYIYRDVKRCFACLLNLFVFLNHLCILIYVQHVEHAG